MIHGTFGKPVRALHHAVLDAPESVARARHTPQTVRRRRAGRSPARAAPTAVRQTRAGGFDLRRISGMNCTADVPTMPRALPVTVVPVASMREGRILRRERVESGDVGDEGCSRDLLRHERAAAHHARRVFLIIIWVDLFVPLGATHLGTETHAGKDAVFPGHSLDVVPDLRLPGEETGPVPRVGANEYRVQSRGDVAGTSRIGVVAPRTRDSVSLFEKNEVVDPLLAQPDRRAPIPEIPAPTITTS